jgi:hypothetical protein
MLLALETVGLCVISNDWLIVNNEFEKMWKKQ